MDAPKCPVCGSEAISAVVSEAEGGRLRQYCRECERRRRFDEGRAARHVADRSTRLLISAGLLLTLLTIAADYLAISGREGFGWRQITGAEIGFLCLAVSLVLRRGEPLAIAGLFLLVLSLGADVLRVGHSPGLGWRNQLALVLAILMLAAGLLLRRILRKKGALTSPTGRG